MPMALASLRRMSVLLQRSLQLIASPLHPGRHSRVYLAVLVCHRYRKATKGSDIQGKDAIWSVSACA